jgi:hypothetical protein
MIANRRNIRQPVVKQSQPIARSRITQPVLAHAIAPVLAPVPALALAPALTPMPGEIQRPVAETAYGVLQKLADTFLPWNVASELELTGTCTVPLVKGFFKMAYNKKISGKYEELCHVELSKGHNTGKQYGMYKMQYGKNNVAYLVLYMSIARLELASRTQSEVDIQTNRLRYFKGHANELKNAILCTEDDLRRREAEICDSRMVTPLSFSTSVQERAVSYVTELYSKLKHMQLEHRRLCNEIELAKTSIIDTMRAYFRTVIFGSGLVGEGIAVHDGSAGFVEAREHLMKISGVKKLFWLNKKPKPATINATPVRNLDEPATIDVAPVQDVDDYESDYSEDHNSDNNPDEEDRWRDGSESDGDCSESDGDEFETHSYNSEDDFIDETETDQRCKIVKDVK